MLLACLRRVAALAEDSGAVECSLNTPALMDADLMILLANDLLEIGGVIAGPEGKIRYVITAKGRALMDGKPLRASYVRHGDNWLAGPCWTDLKGRYGGGAGH